MTVAVAATVATLACRAIVCSVANRDGQCVAGGPASLEASDNCRAWYSGSTRPLSHAKGDPVECDHAITATILRLQFRLLPPAVFRRVSERVFDALDRASAWARTHILKEILEAHPSIAYCDAPSAVVCIRSGMLVQTTLLDTAPDRVFSCFGTSLGGAVRSNRIAPKAAATSGSSEHESGTGDNEHGPAITTATPADGVIPSSQVSYFHDRQAPKFHSCQVDTLVLLLLSYSEVSHAVSSFLGDVVVRGRGTLTTLLGSAQFYLTSQAIR